MDGVPFDRLSPPLIARIHAPLSCRARPPPRAFGTGMVLYVSARPRTLTHKSAVSADFSGLCATADSLRTDLFRWLGRAAGVVIFTTSPKPDRAAPTQTP